MSDAPIVDSDLRSEETSEERYARALPAIMAVPREGVKQFNINIWSAETAVMGCLPRFRALWPQAIQELPLTDPNCLDKLEDYVVAAAWAHSLNITSVRDSDGLPVLYDEAVATRSILHADLNALIQSEFIKPDTIKHYSGQTGYKIVAYDLQMLTTVLLRHWSRIQGKCAVQLSELERADRLASRVLRLASLRDHAPATLTAKAEIAARAMTVFVNCYDDVRRVVCFMRWNEGDADTFAPSLYAGRRHEAKEGGARAWKRDHTV